MDDYGTITTRVVLEYVERPYNEDVIYMLVDDKENNEHISCEVSVEDLQNNKGLLSSTILKYHILKMIESLNTKKDDFLLEEIEKICRGVKE